MPHPRLIRLCLLLLALTPLFVGVGALFFPHTFYGDFPPGSRHWVDRLGPYNEHLVTDFGGALLGQAHSGYHLTTTSAYSTSDNVATIFGLVLSVVLSVALLAYTATATGSRPTAGSVAHSAPSQRSP
jgi:hypothetical protein